MFTRIACILYIWVLVCVVYVQVTLRCEMYLCSIVWFPLVSTPSHFSYILLSLPTPLSQFHRRHTCTHTLVPFSFCFLNTCLPNLLTLESASASDSGSDDEDTAAAAAGVLSDAQKLQEMAGVDADALSGDALSKAKQSRSEKKARKAMFKLGLKSYSGEQR